MYPWSYRWRQHNLGDGSSQDWDVLVGKGYEIRINNSAPIFNNFTFCGKPGAQIRYMEGELSAPSNFKVEIVNEIM